MFFVSRYPKGRLVEVAYEPICRDCSMYFSITASLLDFCFHVSPIASMYGIFTYTFKNQPNVGKYTIHGLFGSCFPQPFPVLVPEARQGCLCQQCGTSGRTSHSQVVDRNSWNLAAWKWSKSGIAQQTSGT